MSKPSTDARALGTAADVSTVSEAGQSATGPLVCNAVRPVETPVVPGYEIIDVLGQGGMGIVYRARHIKLNRLVALKMVLGGERVTPSELIRFLAEAEAVAAVKHANVVQVHEFGEADGRPYMALEFLAGGSLDRVLKDSARRPVISMPARDVARLVSQIARGVAAAHGLGIVHRDLKPANILLDETGVPKVSDFGMAKRRDSEVTALGVVMGTPAYMSPEQAKGESKFAGPQADVWALGVIFYEALTGQRPFRGEMQDILAQVMTADPIAPRQVASAIPRDLELICLKCLAKPAHERYPTAKELADDLDRFARNEPISVRSTGPLERGYKWVKRNKVVSGAMAAVALALLIGSAVSLGFGLEAKKQATQAKISADDAIQKGNELANVNAHLERTNDELNGALASALLGPLKTDGRDTGLTPYEVNAIWNLTTRRGTAVSFRFLEDALRSTESAKQLACRAEYAVHAAIGLDLELYNRFEQLLDERLSAPDTTEEHRTELALLASRLEVLSPGLALRATRHLTGLTQKYRSPHLLPVAQGLAATIAWIEPPQSPKVCAEVTATLMAKIDKLPSNDPDSLRALATCLTAVAARLPPDAATNVLAGAIAKTQDSIALTTFVEGLAAAAARLPPDAAVAALTSGIEILAGMAAKSSDATLLHHVFLALADLTKRLPLDRPTPGLHKAAALLAESLPDKARATGDPYHSVRLAKHLAALAARIDPDEAGRLLKVLLEAVRVMKDPAVLSDLALSVAALARRAKPEVAATACAEVATLIEPLLNQAAVEKGATSGRQQPLAAALVALAEQMEPSKAAAVLTDSLAVMTDAETLRTLAKGVAALVGRLKPDKRDAVLNTALGALSQAIKRSANSPSEFPALFGALAIVAGQMNPEEAAGACDPAASTLAQTMTALADLPNLTPYGLNVLVSLAEPLAAVAPWANRDKAAAACAEGAAVLVRVAGKVKDQFRLRRLAIDVAALSPWLPPDVAAPILIRLAKTLDEVMTQASSPFELRLLISAQMAVAGRMRPRDAAAVINKAAKMLDEALTRAANPFELQQLAEDLAVVAGRMEPSEAAQLDTKATRRLLVALDKLTDPNTLPNLVNALEAVGGRMEPDEIFRSAFLERAAANAHSVQSILMKALATTALGMSSRDSRLGMHAAASAVGDLGAPGSFMNWLSLLHPYFYPRPRPLPAQTLVVLLNHPFCVGEARRAVLDALAFTYDRPFADQWDFVRFVRDNHLPLDLSASTRQRPSHP